MIIKNQISKLLTGCLFVFFCLFIFSGCSTMKNWFSFLPGSDTIKTAGQLDEKDLKEFMASVKTVNGEADSQYKLARHFQKLNRHEIAVEEFLKALKIDPGFYNAYNALGVSYDNLKQHDSAIDAYSAALKINPDLDYVYNNIGYSNLLKGDLEAAANAFEKAIAINAHNKIYQNNLALVRAKSGDNISMTADSRRIEKQDSHPMVGKDQITRETLTEIIEKVTGNKKIEDNYYAVQLGVYYDMNKAVLTLKKARKIGYDSPYMTKIEKDKPYYRVRFGKYQTRAEAEALAATILDKGGRPALTIVETYPVDVFQSEPVQYTALHKNLKIEVLNGNGIYRMARRVGNYFKQKGLSVVTPSNARHFNYPSTRIYYTRGYYDEALKLSQEIPGFEIAGKFIESKKLKTNIRILIGKDIVPFDKELRKI
ncbi:tetratricopeptide repeat protein [Desulfobacula sp.]|uniref:tetratricopeptide repeat protein n=1 Tax=Desulfobacula sp. TaxID=2593537 RepID=UPI002623EA91|nr:tetratricopeptide repeat protein [Desulfobacula sp.]